MPGRPPRALPPSPALHGELAALQVTQTHRSGAVCRSDFSPVPPVGAVSHPREDLCPQDGGLAGDVHCPSSTWLPSGTACLPRMLLSDAAGGVEKDRSALPCCRHSAWRGSVRVPPPEQQRPRAILVPLNAK